MSFRSKLSIGLAVIVVIATLVVPVPKAEAEKAPLQFGIAFKRPIMVTVDIKKSGYITVNHSQYTYDSDIEYTENMVFVDEYMKNSEDEEHATRHYLKDFSKYNGDNTDTALNGVRVDFKRQGEEWEVKLQDNRLLTDQLLGYLLGSAHTLGLWIDLPEDQEVGTSIDVDLGPIYALITQPMGVPKTKCKVRIDSYDRVTTDAVLSGTYEIQGNTNAGGVRTGVVYSGKITIKVNTVESRLVSVALDGEYKYVEGTSSLSGKASGSGEYDCTITTEIDLKKIRKVQKKKPKFRVKKFRAYGIGVGIKLPSHWSRIDAESPARAFVRTLDGHKGQAVIEMKPIDGDSENNPGLFYDQVYASLKGTYPGLTYKKTKSPLGGEGRVYYIPKGSGGDDLHMQTEVYPWRGKFLMLKFYGPPRAYAAAVKEFKKAKSTIRPLNPKRRK